MQQKLEDLEEKIDELTQSVHLTYSLGQKTTNLRECQKYIQIKPNKLKILRKRFLNCRTRLLKTTQKIYNFRQRNWNKKTK